MTMSLTYKQAELLAFIGRYQQDHGGVSPSFEQMKHALGLKSKSGVHRLIEALEERGRIARGHNRARCIEVLAEPPPRSALATFSSRELVAELARRGFSRHAEREAA